MSLLAVVMTQHMVIIAYGHTYSQAPGSYLDIPSKMTLPLQVYIHPLSHYNSYLHML